MQTKTAMYHQTNLFLYFVFLLYIKFDVVNCTLGIDIATIISVDTFECLASEYNYSFAIVRAYHSYGAVDTNAPTTISNAQEGGIMNTDVYHFPCYGKGIF